MNDSEAIDYLKSLGMFGLRFGLDNTRKLAELAGNPQQHLRFIHVAGTNGKGSTCAFLESIYRHSGLKVGLYTSPHLVHFNERIQINRIPAPQHELTQLIAQLKPLVDTFPQDAHPTFFEVTTILAFLYFHLHRCDLVILETGMGGRLDATNIVSPIASVITPIGMDHMEWLGDTLPKIAAEKAGIIKPSIPVITSASQPDSLKVIQSRAAELGSPLEVSTAHRWPFASSPDSLLPLRGAHQISNAQLACTVVQTLQHLLPVSSSQLEQGLRETRWDGRFQICNSPTGNGTLILDGAHNAHGAQALRNTFEQAFPHSKATLILGVLHDKSWRDLYQLLSPIASQVWVVPVQSPRSAAPDEVAATLRTLSPHLHIQPFPSLQAALLASQNQSDPITLLTGSLYLVGEALELLTPPNPASSSASERSLNHWNTSR